MNDEKYLKEKKRDIHIYLSATIMATTIFGTAAIFFALKEENTFINNGEKEVKLKLYSKKESDESGFFEYEDDNFKAICEIGHEVENENCTPLLEENKEILKDTLQPNKIYNYHVTYESEVNAVIYSIPTGVSAILFLAFLKELFNTNKELKLVNSNEEIEKTKKLLKK